MTALSGEQIQELLNKLSQNEVRLGESISAITQSHTALEMRVRALEQAAQSRAITEAREDERDKALYSRLDKIERRIETLEEVKGEVAGVKKDVAVVQKDVGSIKSGFSKFWWAIGTVVITVVVGFALKGGFA